MYDTIYGHQDKTDDKTAGVKSLSLLWGNKTIRYSYMLNNLIFAILAGHGYMFDMYYLYYFQLFFTYCVQTYFISKIDLNKSKSCGKFFNRMKFIGLLLGLAFVLGKAIDKNQKKTSTKVESNKS